MIISSTHLHLSLTTPLLPLLVHLLSPKFSFPLPHSTLPPQPAASCWISSGRTLRTLTSPRTRWATGLSQKRARRGRDVRESQRGRAWGSSCHTDGAPSRWGGPAVKCSHRPTPPHHLRTLLFWICPDQRNWEISHSDRPHSLNVNKI